MSNGLTKHGLNHNKDGEWFNVKEKQSNKKRSMKIVKHMYQIYKCYKA